MAIFRLTMAMLKSFGEKGSKVPAERHIVLHITGDPIISSNGKVTRKGFSIRNVNVNIPHMFSLPEQPLVKFPEMNSSHWIGTMMTTFGMGYTFGLASCGRDEKKQEPKLDPVVTSVAFEWGENEMVAIAEGGSGNAGWRKWGSWRKLRIPSWAGMRPIR